MTDGALRALERRFRASGSVEDEAAWLAARVRAGEVEEARWRLAVFCDYPAARPLRDGLPSCACGATRRSGKHVKRCPLHPRTFAETPGLLRVPPTAAGWARAFDEHGPQALGRAAVAVARATMAAVGSDLADTARALARVDAWLACPCEDHRRACDAPGRAFKALPHHGPSRAVWQALWGATDEFARDAVPFSAAVRLQEAVGLALERVAEVELRAAIRAEVVPWALGYGDPVAERLAARPPAPPSPPGPQGRGGRGRTPRRA